MYSVGHQYQADVKVYVVGHEYQADLKVFFTDREYRAGWKNSAKSPPVLRRAIREIFAKSKRDFQAYTQMGVFGQKHNGESEYDYVWEQRDLKFINKF